MDLIAATVLRSLNLLNILLLWLTFATKVFSSAETSTVFNGNVRVHVITKFKAAAIVVFSTSVALELCLVGRTVIAHWNVALTWNMASDWRHILHLSVGI